MKRLLSQKAVAVCMVVALAVMAFATSSVAAATKIRLSGWTSSPAEEELLQSLIKDFEAKNPDIDVVYEPIPGDYMTKIKSMLAAKNAPDVFYLDVFEAPGLIERNLVRPLNDLMKTTRTEASEFLPTLIDGFSKDGKVYGIPKDFNTLGLFYNKEMFDAAKIAYPDASWTWDDLRDAAKKLTKGGVYGFGVPPDQGRFPVFLFQNGADILTADKKASALNTKAAAEALEFYSGLVFKDKAGARPSDLGNQWQGTLFGQGKVAMVYEGGWLIPYLKNEFPNIKYGVSELPKGPKGRGNLYFTVAYVIPNTSKQPEAAWKLIQHLTSLESQTKVLESGFALPTRVALQDSKYLKQNPNVAAIFKGYAYAKPYQFGEKGARVLDIVAKMLEKVFIGKVDPQDALTEAHNLINKELKD